MKLSFPSFQSAYRQFSPCFSTFNSWNFTSNSSSKINHLLDRITPSSIQATSKTTNSNRWSKVVGLLGGLALIVFLAFIILKKYNRNLIQNDSNSPSQTKPYLSPPKYIKPIIPPNSKPPYKVKVFIPSTNVNEAFQKNIPNTPYTEQTQSPNHLVTSQIIDPTSPATPNHFNQYQTNDNTQRSDYFSSSIEVTSSNSDYFHVNLDSSPALLKD